MQTISKRGSRLSYSAHTAAAIAKAGYPLAAFNSRKQLHDGSNDADYAAFRQESSRLISCLTVRQLDVLDLIVAGARNKNIAFTLKISQRTVENHRAAIAKSLGAKSIAELVHRAICGRCCSSNPTDRSLPASYDMNDQAIGASPSLSKQPRAGQLVPYTNGTRVAPVGGTSLVDATELKHRMKNFISVIQSISHLTMHHCTTMAEFDSKFRGRLTSLSKSLDRLVSNDWSGMSIHELIASQLEPFGLLGGTQILTSGPDVILTTTAAHYVGLALHELATNAVKHGALSVPNGTVILEWALPGLYGQQRFQMSWSETGGPVVNEPTRHGFGRTLIEKAIGLALGGTAKCTFLPQGMSWCIDVPQSTAIALKPVPDAHLAAPRGDRELLTGAPSPIGIPLRRGSAASECAPEAAQSPN